jgi:hypothetical protein
MKKAAPRRPPLKKPPTRPPGALVPPGTRLIIPLASSLAGTNVTALTDVRLLAERQMKIEDEITEIEARLADANRRLQQVKQEDLPLAFDAAGITRLDLPDGIVIKVADFVTGSIKQENQVAAFKWLRDNKFGALIKSQFKLAFGKGEDKIAKRLAAFLKKSKIQFERSEGVHPMTLKAFIREQLAAGKGLPAAIEVTSVPTATVHRPKE